MEIAWTSVIFGFDLSFYMYEYYNFEKKLMDFQRNERKRKTPISNVLADWPE